MYSMAMPVGGVETAYQAGAALGTGALSMLLPLYRKSWKRSVVAGEDLNTSTIFKQVLTACSNLVRSSNGK